MRVLSALMILVASGCALFASNTTIEQQARWAAPGFVLEEVYHVPRDEQGSWIRIAVEGERTLLASSENGRLYRVTLPGPNGEPVTVTDVGLDLGPAQGLLVQDNTLYMLQSVAAFSPFTVLDGARLYRLRDEDRDGTYENVETLRTFSGSGEHGPHQVASSPDGERLYLIAGNATGKTDFERSRQAVEPEEDQLLEVLPCFMFYPPRGGWVAELSPNGELEVIASGLRNAYGVAVDRDGELFSFDADMEWDIGMPWYRPTRVLHLVSGGDYGWRYGSAKWADWYADSLPAVVDIGAASPTGVTFAYDTKFPGKYRDALIIGDWSLGRVYAVHLEPDGGSYTGTAEILAAGKPLPVSDLVAHPGDGAVYIATGGRDIATVLYRLRAEEPSDEVPASGEKTNATVALRRRLESRHPEGAKAVDQEAWAALGHSDRHVRHAARVALEHVPTSAWREKALELRVGSARTNALIALARTGSKADQPRALLLLAEAPADESEQATRDRLRAIHLWLSRHGTPDASTRAALIEAVDATYPSDDTGMNRLAGEILVFLNAPSARTKTLALLESAPTQEEQVRYAYLLSAIGDGWTEAERVRVASWFRRADAFPGGNCVGDYLEDLEDRSFADVSWLERGRIDDQVEDAAPDLVMTEVEPKGPGHTWTVSEVETLVEGGLAGRDFEQGQAMFVATGCWSCHRFANRGGALGPDLSAVGNRMDHTSWPRRSSSRAG